MRKNSPEYFDYFNFPIGICLYSLQKKKTNQVKLFLYLKSISSNGYMQNTKSVFLTTSNQLGICYKTLRTHMKWLISQGWIVPDPIAHNYRIVGFNMLTEKLGFTMSTGAILYKDDIPKFKSFAVAAAITYLMDRIRVRRRQIEAGLIKGGPNLGNLPAYPFLPHTYLAKALGLSKSTAYEYRKLTMGNEFLRCIKKFNKLDVSSENFNLLKRYASFGSDALLKNGKRVMIQLPDQIKSNVYLRTKVNIRESCHKNRLGKNPDLIKRNLTNG